MTTKAKVKAKARKAVTKPVAKAVAKAVKTSADKPAIRRHLLNGIAKQAGVEELMRKVEDARAGMYSHGVLAAIAAGGDANAFGEVCETLANDFRANKRGLADKFKCPQQKTTGGDLKTDGDGNPIYKVPSSLSAMRTHLTQAIEYKVDLTVTAKRKGSKPKPASYTAIKDAKDVAKAAKDKATASPDDKARDAIREVLASIDERIGKLEGAALKAAMKLLQTTASDLDKVA